MDAFTIDCDECAMQHTETCRDCVVTYLCERRAGLAFSVDGAEVRALSLLAVAGLTAPLRHRPRP
jgi:hypothetical protein